MGKAVDINHRPINPGEIFKFGKRDIVFHLMYEKKMNSKFVQAFNYVIEKIKPQDFTNNLSSLKWDKGKNYHWASIKKDNIIFLIRHYRTHFTIYFKIEDYGLFHEINFDISSYGCFTFYTNTELLSDDESDERVDNNFLDLNNLIENIFNHINKNWLHLLSNSASLPRPKHVEIKNVWDGGKDFITSIDEFIFCCEELFGKYQEYFAINEVLEKIKTFKVGDMLGVYKITKIKTTVKDDYYHNVGIEIQNTNFPNSKPEFKDVYSLAHWHYNLIFPENK